MHFRVSTNNMDILLYLCVYSQFCETNQNKIYENI